MKNFRKILAHLWADVQACFGTLPLETHLHILVEKGDGFRSLCFEANCPNIDYAMNFLDYLVIVVESFISLREVG